MHDRYKTEFGNGKGQIPKISLISLGCPKNLVDSENMLGILAQHGFEITLDEASADFVIVNTCSFIQEAEKESVKTILGLTEAGKRVIITGCLAQKHREELQKAIPEAYAFVGTADYHKIAEVIQGKLSFEVAQKPVYEHKEDIKRFHISVGAGAYIKIAEGCDYSCSFCVIPALRGQYISRPMESIVNEARKLGKEGLGEIILIAQDTTGYGRDIYGKPSLPMLLEELNNMEELSWIRLMYFYPSMVTDELLDAIAGLQKVVKYIDIPLQHSHPDVLRAMNRPVIDNGALIEHIREKLPGVALRTVFITGFPGETEEHFRHLYDFIEKYRFDRLGIFEYSRERSTPSGSFRDQIPAKLKKQRKKRLMELQQGISKEINRSFTGSEIPVIIETIAPGRIIGRTYRDAPEIDGAIYLESDKSLQPGDIVRAKVTEAYEYDLRGEVL